MLDESKVYIIAEIGGNHEGDFQRAMRLLHSAVKAGADAVKFQIYTGDTLVNRKEDPNRVRHFDRFALSEKQYIQLALECKTLGVDFLASVWSEQMIATYGAHMPFYKVGSGDLTAHPILKKIVEVRKPIILSTGLASLDEIRESVDYICSLDQVYESRYMLAILQCTSMYPIPDSDANISVVTALQKDFDYVIGYSDHTTTTNAAEIAVALGASILEVHFTDNKHSTTFRDHLVSFDADDLKNLRDNVDRVKDLLGDGRKRPMRSEIENGHLVSFRRALYPARDIRKGEIIGETDLIALRPANGVAANRIGELLGKSAARDFKRFDVLSITDFS